MAKFLIQVPVKPYRGSKPALIRKHAEQRELAKQIEEYINSQEAKEPTSQVFTYSQLAHRIGCKPEQVRRILMIFGGNTGITVGARES